MREEKRKKIRRRVLFETCARSFLHPPLFLRHSFSFLRAVLSPSSIRASPVFPLLEVLSRSSCFLAHSILVVHTVMMAELCIPGSSDFAGTALQEE